MRARRGAAMMVAAWLAAGCVIEDSVVNIGHDEEVEIRHRSVALLPGEQLEVWNVNGDIEAEPVAGGEAEIRAVISGRASDVERTHIVETVFEGGVAICALFPSPPGHRNVCTPGGTRQEIRDAQVRVDLTVGVPSGVALVARTVNGDLDATGLEDDVSAATVNGGIRVSTLGHAEAAAVNGTLRVSFGRADWQGVLRFTTVNGSVNVVVPADVSADVHARATNGSVTTEFPLRLGDGPVPREAWGRLGAGGRELRLSTVNGSVHLGARP